MDHGVDRSRLFLLMFLFANAFVCLPFLYARRILVLRGRGRPIVKRWGTVVWNVWNGGKAYVAEAPHNGRGPRV
jgi:hypothetical protein